ncbi:MAG: hypothetical protein IPL26_06900 [Leptospiraceae bacterium]|nr:hypothetical protein [Leptospiraceae bacterium]
MLHNFALGLEYFLTDNFSVRGGAFTNNSDSKNINWLRTAIKDTQMRIGDRNSIRNG